MRLPTLTIALFIALSFSLASQANAQQYVDTTKLDPFKAECGFMSKAGYLRYRYYISSGKWLTLKEAEAISDGQG